MDEKIAKILEILAESHPRPRTALNFRTPFELLIATILSAQCTDKRVNQITARLFQKYRTPEDFAALPQEVLEEEIKDCGLFRNKSKNIIETCRILVDKHGGEVPSTREELMELPGVGRKTANVILSNAFGQPALAVDTHVFRVANRLGLADSDDVYKTELQLLELVPRESWSDAHHLLIFHGREICSARNPKCDICRLRPYCRAASKDNSKKDNRG
ncbi:MAG: endonuclease III [Syntrophothermus sp.]